MTNPKNSFGANTLVYSAIEAVRRQYVLPNVVKGKVIKWIITKQCLCGNTFKKLQNEDPLDGLLDGMGFNSEQKNRRAVDFFVPRIKSFATSITTKLLQLGGIERTITCSTGGLPAEWKSWAKDLSQVATRLCVTAEVRTAMLEDGFNFEGTGDSPLINADSSYKSFLGQQNPDLTGVSLGELQAMEAAAEQDLERLLASIRGETQTKSGALDPSSPKVEQSKKRAASVDGNQSPQSSKSVEKQSIHYVLNEKDQSPRPSKRVKKQSIHDLLNEKDQSPRPSKRVKKQSIHDLLNEKDQSPRLSKRVKKPTIYSMLDSEDQ